MRAPGRAAECLKPLDGNFASCLTGSRCPVNYPADTSTHDYRLNYSVRCDDWAYELVKWAFVLPMLFVYPIGVPCLYAYILRRHRATLTEMRRIELLGAAYASSSKRRSRNSVVQAVKALDDQKKAERRRQQIEEKRAELPSHVSKLIAGYEMRMYLSLIHI